MRTKSLVLAIAFSAVGVASSMAQVYSQNAVGYVNIDLRQGYNLIANQFILRDAVNGDNNINSVFPAVEDGSLILIFNSAPPPAGQKFLDAYVFVDGVGWVDSSGPEPVISTAVISPGSGLFFFAPSARTITLVGEVPETENGTFPSINIPPAYSIVSQGAPQALGVDTVDPADPGAQLPANDGDFILFFNNFNAPVTPAKFLDAIVYVGGVGWVDASGPEPVLVNPTPQPGQAFFYNNGGAAINWNRTFNVQ